MDDMHDIYRKIGNGRVRISVRDRSQQWRGVRFEREAALLPPEHTEAPLRLSPWQQRIARIKMRWWNNIRRPF